MSSCATKIQDLLYAFYRHQTGRHLRKREACSTMSYNSSAKKKIHQNTRELIFKYSTMLLNTYPRLLGWIDCREECWQHQRLVEIIKYFATSSDYLKMRHCFWRESGGVFCTFISEGRMFSTLKRLNATTHKGKDHMVTSNSFVFEICNGSKDTFDLLATRSCTRLVCLDLGGASNSFRKRRFEVPDMKPETFPLDSFTRWIIS